MNLRMPLLIHFKTFKQNNILLILLCSIFSITTFSCTKNIEVDPQSNIYGWVEVFGVDNYKLNEVIGVEVLLKGDNLQRRTKVKRDGTYLFEGIKKGNYSLTFEGDKIGTAYIDPIVHLGTNSNSIRGKRLFEKADFRITTLNIKESSENLNLKIEGKSTTNKVRTIHFYFSKWPDVTSIKYEAVIFYYLEEGNNGEISLNLGKEWISWFLERGFKKGDRVYLRAYPASIYSFMDGLLYEGSHFVFTNLGESYPEVKSFIL